MSSAEITFQKVLNSWFLLGVCFWTCVRLNDWTPLFEYYVLLCPHLHHVMRVACHNFVLLLLNFSFSETKEVAFPPVEHLSSAQKGAGRRTMIRKSNSQMLKLLLSCQRATFLWWRMEGKWDYFVCVKESSVALLELFCPELSGFYFLH